MKTSTYSVVDENTPVEGSILYIEGQGLVMYLTIGEGSTRLTIQPRDAAFLDKLSNEADRLCREFVGDVPGGQATLTSAVTREPVNFTFPEPTTVVVP